MTLKYVNAIGGDNDNSGLSHAAAWATCTYGLLHCVAGDILYLDGTFTETWGTSLTIFPSGTEGNPITITSYDPDNHAIIKGQDSHAVLYLQDFPAYLSFINLEFDAQGVSQFGCDASGDHLIFQDCEMHHTTNGSGCLTTGYRCQFLNCNMHHCGASEQDHGLYLHYIENIVDGGTYHHNTGYGIQCYDSGQTDWDGNIIRNTQCYSNLDGLLISSGHNLKAYGNICYSNTVSGISIGTSSVATNTQTLNNTCFGNGGYGILIGSGGGGGSVNAIVRNNLVYGNGTDIQNTGTGSTIDHNLSTDPDYVDSADPPLGFKIESTSDARGAGVDVGILRDFSGALYATPPSIGAFEFAGDSPPPAGDPPIETFNYSVGAISGLNTGTNWTTAWSDQGTSATSIAATPTGGAGVKVAKLSPTSTNMCKIERFYGAVETGIFYFTAYATANGTGALRTFLLMQGGTPSPSDGVTINLGPALSVDAYDYGIDGWVSVGSYAINTWVLIGIEIDASGHADQFRVQINGGAFSSWMDAAAPMPSLNVIHAFSNDSAADFYIGSIGVNQNVTHDYYYAATAAGDGNGTTAANAWAYNDSTHGMDTAFAQTAGNTLHVCGTITGAVAFRLMTITHSGSIGNPITIKFEPSSIVQAPYLDSLGCIYGDGVSWITIDGGSSSGNTYGSNVVTNGIIRATANGTSQTYQEPSIGIQFNRNTDGSHCIVQNLSVLNMYIKDEWTDDPGASSAQGTACIIIGNSNIEVTHCTVTFAYGGIGWGTPGAPAGNVDIGYNICQNLVHSITVTADAVASAVRIHHNELIGGGFYWVEPSAETFHINPIFSFTDGPGGNGHFNDLRIDHNYIHGQWGSNHVERGGATSCFAFLEWLYPQLNHPCIIDNNLWVAYTAGSSAANLNSFGTGAILPDLGTTGDLWLFNNTFAGWQDNGIMVRSPDAGANGGILAKNNVFYDTGAYSGNCVVSTSSNYNNYYKCGVSGNTIQYTVYANATAWKAAGYDAYASASVIIADFGLDASYVPNASSLVYHLGVDLSGLGIVDLGTSFNGVARGSGSAWTIGANDFSGAPVAVPVTVKRIRMLI